MEEKGQAKRYSVEGRGVPPGPGAEQELDQLLIRRAQQGDAQAVTELYMRYQRKVLNYLYRFVGNRQTAEDLTQETFVRVVRHLPSYRPTGPVGGWIYRIARNLALNRFRHERVAPEIPLDQPLGVDAEGEEGSSPSERLADPSPGPGQEAIAADLGKTVQAALLQISPLYREAVILCDVQGYAYKEAAELLGCPIDTIASRLARGRAKLAEDLGYLKKEMP